MTTNLVPVTLHVNGERHDVEIDVRTSLLDALREKLRLTGSKKGCDHGQCGACTVLRDGLRINSCLTLAVAQQGAEIVSVEGLEPGGGLHPMQEAFLDLDAYQCGYCTPGQICSAVGMIDEAAQGWPSAVTPDVAAGLGAGDVGAEDVDLDDDEVRERMSGNICRCAAYANIVPAVRSAARATQAARVAR